MKFKNSDISFGLISIFLHWSMAILLIGLFVLGTYMVRLDYYDPFYHAAPWWHKSFGLVVLALLICRIFWKLYNPKVLPLPQSKRIEIHIAKIVQALLYILLIVSCVSGYLISTAKGANIAFFDWFEFPALISNGSSQADVAGKIHFYATLSLIILSGLHIMAALKHHFIDKDKTLIRILTTRDTQNEK